MAVLLQYDFFTSIHREQTSSLPRNVEQRLPFLSQSAYGGCYMRLTSTLRGFRSARSRGPLRDTLFPPGVSHFNVPFFRVPLR